MDADGARRRGLRCWCSVTVGVLPTSPAETPPWPALRAIDRCSTEKETMNMNDQMRIGMREATRLTRAGRLLEATAIIQRTLRGLAPDLGGDATNQPADEAIEGTFRVIDPTPRPTEEAAQEPDLRSNIASVVALPPHTAEAPPRRRDSSAELTNPQPPPRATPPTAPPTSTDLAPGREPT